MPKNKLPWIIVVLLLIAGAVFLIRQRSAQRGAQKQINAIEAKPDNAPPGSLPTDLKDPTLLPKREELSDDFRDPRLKMLTQQDSYTPSLKDLDGFLSLHQRSQEALLAAFAVCHDQQLLDELMEKAPGEKTYAAVMLWSENDETVDKAVAALKELQPKNPLPYLVQLSKTGELSPDEMKKALAAAGEAKLDLSELRPAALRDEAWQSVVKDPVKSWAYGLQTLSFDLETIDSIANGILDLQTASQTGDGNDSANFQKSLTLSEALRSDSTDIASVADSKINGLELEILGTVDAESSYPHSNIKVQERIDQLEAQMEADDSLDDKMQDFLRQASPEQVDAFVGGWREKGMNAALRGLTDGEKH